MTTTGCPALATTMGMVNGVHGYAANLGTLAKPARTTGLADGDILMIDIADLADSGHTILKNHANFA